MKRFDWRGWTWLSLTNFFLAALFNKLLVRIDHYRDDQTDILIKSEYKLWNRLDYNGEK